MQKSFVDLYQGIFKPRENLDFYELKLIEFRLSHLSERKKDFSGLRFLKILKKILNHVKIYEF